MFLVHIIFSSIKVDYLYIHLTYLFLALVFYGWKLKDDFTDITDQFAISILNHAVKCGYISHSAVNLSQYNLIVLYIVWRSFSSSFMLKRACS